jgi:hypothetical protein
LLKKQAQVTNDLFYPGFQPVYFKTIFPEVVVADDVVFRIQTVEK